MGKWFDIFVLFIILIKLIFIGLTLYNIYLIQKLKRQGENKKVQDLEKSIEFWKERVDFIFIAAMSVVLLYLFHPLYKTTAIPYIDYDTRLLLFLYGVITLLTAKWTVFFGESPTLEYLQKMLG